MRCSYSLLLLAAAAQGAAASRSSDNAWLRRLRDDTHRAVSAHPIRYLSAEEGLMDDEKMSKAEQKAKMAESEAEEEGIIMLKWATVVGIASLAGTFIVGFMLEQRHVHWLPEAGVGILIGILVSGIGKYFHESDLLEKEKFDFEFFMIWLLPPIIFEAGFNMNVQAFLSNIYPTAFFAFIGTFASTFIVGGLVYYAGQIGLCYPLGMLASLTFGSLISATDPVTVLAVFQAIGVKVDLFSMVFGESVLNDAVAIVLSRTLLSFNEPGTTVDQESIMAACQLFAIIFLGSMIIGMIAGLISSLVFKLLDLKHHDEMLYMEAALSFSFPWCAYFVAEASELSGIVAILACGMVMATYTRLNFSPRAIRLTARAYKCIALVAETFVFVYLGMACITFPIFESTVWQFCFWATMACFVGRLHIYVGSWLTNCFRGPTSQLPPISPAYQFVMWFSGLRGGVAFALASVSYTARDFPAVCGGITGPDAEELKSLNPHCGSGHYDSLAILQTTMLIAVFTIFVFGGSITTVAIAFDVLRKKGDISQDAEGERSTEKLTRNSRWSVEAGHNFLLNLLTNEYSYPRDTGARFDIHDEEEGQPSDVEAQFKERALQPRVFAPGSTTLVIKQEMSEQQLHSAFGSTALARQKTKEDKVDELRSVLPGLSTKQLEKALDDAAGDVKAAAMAQGTAGGLKELL